MQPGAHQATMVLGKFYRNASYMAKNASRIGGYYPKRLLWLTTLRPEPIGQARTQFGFAAGWGQRLRPVFISARGEQVVCPRIPFIASRLITP